MLHSFSFIKQQQQFSDDKTSGTPNNEYVVSRKLVTTYQFGVLNHRIFVICKYSSQRRPVLRFVPNRPTETESQRVLGQLTVDLGVSLGDLLFDEDFSECSITLRTSDGLYSQRTVHPERYFCRVLYRRLQRFSLFYLSYLQYHKNIELKSSQQNSKNGIRQVISTQSSRSGVNLSALRCSLTYGALLLITHRRQDLRRTVYITGVDVQGFIGCVSLLSIKSLFPLTSYSLIL